MLPSNPRAGRSRSVSRLPTTVQSRSVSRTTERYSAEDDRGGRGRIQEGGYTRQVRPQRSMGNIQPSRKKEPALPPPVPKSDYGSPSTRPAPSAYPRLPPFRGSDSSSSSISSSRSSFLDRMRHRAEATSSSQSSFELVPEDPKDTRGIDGAQGLGLFEDGSAPTAKAEQELVVSDLVSYGYSIWNRVATTASAWAWNGSSNSAVKGVAPSSGDSEIARALKAYYLSKARDRSDLPGWLFDERERRVDTEKATQRSVRNDERSLPGAAESVTRTRGRGFRDIYDSVTSATPEPRMRGRNGDDGKPVFGSGASGASRAADRLKALRDAKRQAASAGRVTELVGARSVNERRSADVYDTRYEDSWSSRRGGRGVMGAEPAKRMPARVGLPTNPRRR